MFFCSLLFYIFISIQGGAREYMLLATIWCSSKKPPTSECLAPAVEETKHLMQMVNLPYIILLSVHAHIDMICRRHVFIKAQSNNADTSTIYAYTWTESRPVWTDYKMLYIYSGQKLIITLSQASQWMWGSVVRSFAELDCYSPFLICLQKLLCLTLFNSKDDMGIHAASTKMCRCDL